VQGGRVLRPLTLARPRSRARPGSTPGPGAHRHHTSETTLLQQTLKSPQEIDGSIEVAIILRITIWSIHTTARFPAEVVYALGRCIAFVSTNSAIAVRRIF
jgi:hypothetical protein